MKAMNMTAKRILASAFDWIVLLALATVIPNFVNTQDQMAVVSIAGLSLFFLICVFHNFLFLASRGATPGKMIFGLKIVKVDGSGLTIKQSFMRTVYSIGGGWLFGPGLKASAFFNPERRHWYDLNLGTKVISTRSPAMARPVRKNLGWVLVVVITGFFIWNHAKSARHMVVAGGNLLFSYENPK